MDNALKNNIVAPQPFRFRQSETLLLNVMDNAAVGMLLLDTEGRWLYVNRAYAERLGYTPQECIALGARGLIHPDDLALARQQLNSLVNGEAEGYRTDRRYLRKDGGIAWGLTSSSMLLDERTGEPLYIIVQVTDIDGQKRAEEALAAAEQRWNLALERAGQGVWDHDFKRNLLFYSPIWYTMRGMVPNAEVGTSSEAWAARLHPDDRARVLKLISGAGAGTIPSHGFAYRERHHNGHYIWVLSRGGPVEWDENGVATRFLGTDTDISTLKAVEAALAAEKERLRVTLQSIGDGVISADAEGRVIFMNPMAEEMTDWSAADAVGRKVEEVFSVVDDVSGERLTDPVKEALTRGELYHLEGDAVLFSRSGQRRSIRDSAAPVRTPEGELLGAVLVFQDVTQAHALQKELAHSAVHDSLTELPNRKAFERALTEGIDQARQGQREHALCFVDLDRFKAVNDNAGHAAGDALLRQVGNLIRSACRSEDFTARIGGDEFAILLTDCSIADAEKAAQQVIDLIAAVRFNWQGKIYTIGTSVGITPITSISPLLAELMGQADAACYAAKNAGGNRATVFEPSEALTNFAQIA